MLGPTHYAIVDGYQLAYHRAGSGEPVILVHGITTYSFIWQEVAPLLEAAGYDVIVLDLLGCGESDMPLDVSYAIKDHAERLHGLASVLGIEKFHLVGHDLGGGAAQIFAVRFPDMLHDLSLLNSVGYDLWPVQPIIAVRTPVVRQLMMAALDVGAFRLIVRQATHDKALVTDELMAQFHKPLTTSTGRRAFMHFARCLDNQNLTEIADDLRRLDVPTLIIRGDEDPFLSPEIAERLHADIPDSTLVRIPKASHFVQIDAPEETATTLLDHFETSRA